METEGRKAKMYPLGYIARINPHHVSEAHLQRYVTEFDFRYNNRTAMGFTDLQRANTALKGIGGKRLTYRRTTSSEQA